MSWNRFTEKARTAVLAAQAEAIRFGQPEISTEHLLIALLQDEENVACRLLKQAQVSPQNVRALALKYPQQGACPAAEERWLSPSGERVFDFTYEEARLFNCNYIGTEHLMLVHDLYQQPEKVPLSQEEG